MNNFPDAKLISEQMRDAIKAIATEHGLEVTKSNRTWNDNDFSFNVTISKVNTLGVRQEFIDDFVRQHVVPQACLNTMFDFNGKPLTLVGYNRKAKKYKYVVVCASGKQYKMSASDVNNAYRTKMIEGAA